MTACNNSSSNSGGPGVSPQNPSVIDFSNSRFTANPAKSWKSTPDKKIDTKIIVEAYDSVQRKDEQCLKKNDPQFLNPLRKAFDPRFLALGSHLETTTSTWRSNNIGEWHISQTSENRITNADQGNLQQRQIIEKAPIFSGYSGPVLNESVTLPMSGSWHERLLKIVTNSYGIRIEIENIGQPQEEWSKHFHPQFIEFATKTFPQNNSEEAQKPGCVWNSNLSDESTKYSRVEYGTYRLDSGATVSATLTDSTSLEKEVCNGVENGKQRQSRRVQIRTNKLVGLTLNDYCNGTSVFIASEDIGQQQENFGYRTETTNGVVR